MASVIASSGIPSAPTLIPRIQNERQQSTDANQNSQSDNRGTTKSPFFVKAIATPNSTSKATQDTKNSQDEQTNVQIAFWTKISALSAALLFIAALGQIALFVWQLRLIHETLQDAEEASASATVAANASREQAETLKNSLALSKETTERELRAYLGIISAGISVKHSNRERAAGTEPAFNLEIKFKLKNTGRTPVYKMRGKGAIKFARKFNPRWLQVGKFFSQDAYILPGTETHYVIFESMEKLNAGVTGGVPNSHNFFVFGRLEYVDAFGEARWTNFRYVITGALFAGEGGLSPCEDGNDAN